MHLPANSAFVPAKPFKSTDLPGKYPRAREQGMPCAFCHRCTCPPPAALQPTPKPPGRPHL